jgi:hypothetical protein
VLEERVLKRIFRLKWHEAKGEWRKLCSGQLDNLYPSPNIIKQIQSKGIRWAEHVAHMGGERKFYKLFGGKAQGTKNTRKTEK